MNLSYQIGRTYFELSNHLGNVLTVVTDRKYAQHDGSGGISYYTPDVVSVNDYYPFGMQMSERSFSSDNYRYGFQGQEKDNEIKGSGNSYDFGARLLDVRLGRWLTVDPLAGKYPAITPFSNVSNNPIIFIDINGEDIWVFITKTTESYSGHTMIGVTEYDSEGKETGNILVYELTPQDGAIIIGDNAVKGNVTVHTVKKEDLSTFGNNHSDVFLQLETSKIVDEETKKILDEVDSKMDSGELKYKAGSFNCTTLAIGPLAATKTDNSENLGVEEGNIFTINFKAHSPNKLWNDLLNNKNLKTTSNGKKKLEEGMVEKYLKYKARLRHDVPEPLPSDSTNSPRDTTTTNNVNENTETEKDY